MFEIFNFYLKYKFKFKTVYLNVKDTLYYFARTYFHIKVF